MSRANPADRGPAPAVDLGPALATSWAAATLVALLALLLRSHPRISPVLYRILCTVLTLALAGPAAGQAPRLAYPPGAETIERVLRPGVGKIAPLDSAELRASMDTLVARVLESSLVPGMVVAVVQDGRVVLLRGYGYADLERRRRV